MEIYKVTRCCGSKYILHNFDTIYEKVQNMQIHEDEKRMIICRIDRIFRKVSNLQLIYKYSYFYSKVFIVIASVISPAITSLNTDKNKTYYLLLWWVIWNLQICISISTSISTFFKWDRNYFLYSEYKDKIEEEVWSFLQCINEYESVEANIPLFFKRLEDIYSALCLKDTELKLNSVYNTRILAPTPANSEYSDTKTEEAHEP